VKQKGEKKRKFWCTLLALGTSSCSAFILSAILSLRSCKQARGKSETVATADQTSNPCSSASLLRAAEAVETSQNFGEKLGRATVVLKLKDAAGQTDALTRTDVKALKKKNWERRERWWASGIHVRRCCEGPWPVPSSPARAAAAVAPPLLQARLRQPVPSRHPKPRLLRSSALALVRPLTTQGG
jgi:hypothetical protein